MGVRFDAVSLFVADPDGNLIEIGSWGKGER